MTTRSQARNLLALTLSFVTATLTSNLSAQKGGSGEAEMIELAAEELAGYAKSCFSAGFHRRAKEVWLEVIHDYDTDHAASREALGFLRVGRSWGPDTKFEFPTEDKPDAAAARSLEKRWGKVCKELGTAHRKLALALRKAGDEASAKRHFIRTLRFLPDDKGSLEEREATSFEGVRGRPVEVRVLERTRGMERKITALKEQEFEVEDSTERSEVLDAANLEYVAVESGNFRVFGDFDVELLREAAANSERSLAFCEEFFVGDENFGWKPSGDKHAIAFLQKDDDWKRVIQENASAFQPDQLAFILEHARITRVAAGGETLRVGAFGGAPDVNDFAIREVVQVFAGVRRDAFREGVGHAVVGMFFDRNLIFTVAQEKEEGGTSSGADKEDKRFEAPDLSIWKDLAAEAAWNHSDVPTAELPLLTAADFSSKARVKAWSICDYALRRDPSLIKRLDATADVHGAKNKGSVQQNFEEVTGMPLREFDQDWREFWTLDTPVMRAVRGDKTPLESVSKVAPLFLDAFNLQRYRLRDPFKTEPVSWVAEFSEQCQDHVLYLKANKSERGAAKEHTQDPKKKGFREPAREFAHRALIETKAKPKELDKLVSGWMAWPGYRDALLDRSLRYIGVYGAGSILVADVTRGIRGERHTAQYPANNGRNLPFEVTVAELGPEVKSELVSRGHKKAKVIGYPLTYHFYSGMPEPTSIKATLRRGKDVVPGFLHIANGNVRRSCAPGLVVFYAFEPLARGAKFELKWEFEEHGEPKTTLVKFSTQ